MVPVQTRFEELRFDYEEAFERLCKEVRALRSLDPHADVDAARELRRRVEAARAEYKKTRDELADFMLRRQGPPSSIYYDGI